ncbi:MAG: winged helix-turn-helix domain-containing protein, partial [Rhodospirillaceae bacterium]
LVIDVMMPGEDGLSLTRHVHDTLGVPVLMLSARGETDDRIVGLQSGADDYLTKPFEPLELVLRIKSILRRAAAETTDQTAAESGPRISVITMGACSFDLDRLELLRDGAPVHLTGTESALLLALAERAGTSVSREDLADLTGADGNPRTIDVQVTRLRKKIEADPRLPRHLQTIRGKGYLLRPGP